MARSFKSVIKIPKKSPIAQEKLHGLMLVAFRRLPIKLAREVGTSPDLARQVIKLASLLLAGLSGWQGFCIHDLKYCCKVCFAIQMMKFYIVHLVYSVIWPRSNTQDIIIVYFVHLFA